MNKNTRIHYEVDSEINPNYVGYGANSSYYGIYHVVKYDGDKRIEVIKTFDDPFTARRDDAYRLARELEGKK